MSTKKSMLSFFKKILFTVLIFFLISVTASSQKQENGTVQITIVDSNTLKPTPVRLLLSKNNNAVEVTDKEAIAVMYGYWDHADGYASLKDGSFYIDGKFNMDLSPGTYNLSISKGFEYIAQQHVFEVQTGKTTKQVFKMARWINMPQRGWYSADDHIHIRRSPHEDSLVLSWTEAEDVNVGVLLQMGDFWETYYAQYAWGEKGVYQRNNYLLTSGQEDPRTPELGHAIGMGAPEMVRYKEEYYLYDKVFDRLHNLKGFSGYAHQATSFHAYRGLVLDGLRNKVDMLEILQYCISGQPLKIDHYYHLLDLGIPITAMAGSDFPYCGSDHDNGLAVVASSKIGNVRFYTYAGKHLDYKSWKEGLAAGHTFVSSGPMLEFHVNDSIPGDHLHVSKGTKLIISAKAFGHPSKIPLSKLEIVGHGKVLGSVTPNDSNQSSSQLSLQIEIPAEHGIWIAARAYGDSIQAAHTTPVYITVDSSGFYNPETSQKYLALSEEYLQEIEKEIKTQSTNAEHQAWKYREELQKRVDETREIIQKLKIKFK